MLYSSLGTTPIWALMRNCTNGAIFLSGYRVLFVQHHPSFPARINLEKPSFSLSLIAMSSTRLDDGRVGSRIENYSGFWQKDTSKEAQVDSDTRVENYTDVVNGAAH